MAFENVSAKTDNRFGLLDIAQLQKKSNGGLISLPGTLDTRKGEPRAVFHPRLEGVEIGTILKTFGHPIAFTGKLSLAGDLSGSDIDARAFYHGQQGQAHVEVNDARMEGMNLQQMIQQTVEHGGGDVKSQQNLGNVARLGHFIADMTLGNGEVTLDDMADESTMLALTGKGTLDLVKQNCDTLFNIRMLGDWDGESKLISFLKATPVPLRVYSQWQSLNYSLQAGQLLRKHLQDEAKRHLNDWAGRDKDSRSGKNVRELLDRL